MWQVPYGIPIKVQTQMSLYVMWTSIIMACYIELGYATDITSNYQDQIFLWFQWITSTETKNFAMHITLMQLKR